MSFVLSKIAWAVLEPGNLLVLLLVAGAIALFASARAARTGRVVVALATLCLLAICALPLADWLAGPLEDRFPRPVLPERVDGIIMLGGAVNPRLGRDRGEPSVNEAAERILAFVELGRRYPTARLVASGGSGSLLHPDEREDSAVRGALEQVGFDTGRVLFEDKSRNTWENALFSQALAKPMPGETWLLVTSGIHMPRSIGIFRRVGWPVIAWPVDYRATTDRQPLLRFDLQENLSQLSAAVREWFGLLAYRAMDRTDSLFPGPDLAP